MTRRVWTMGVYGTTEPTFFDALQEIGADLFVDLRARRGLRGSEYSYANSERLQAGLRERGIRYEHVKELAPPEDVRQAQAATDQAEGVLKRSRTTLGPVFAERYTQAIADYDLSKLEALMVGAANPVLFCVESRPEACHRGIVAGLLAARGWEVQHWVPSA